MKKFGLFSVLLVGGLLLTGCNKTVEQNNEIMDDCVTVDGEDKCAVDTEEPIVEETKINEPEILTINPEIDNTGWEWTNTTESNNYYTYRANIVRTGNIYDYRNEEYGFQFTLPESWNGCIVAHRQSVNNQTAKIDYESFQLLCPRKYAGSNEMHSYIPEGYSETADLIVIGPDTDEWTLNSVADQELIENNKYKFGFGITGGSRDIFDGKIILSDLECGKYPNCLCIEKQSYEVGEFWDNAPNPHQDIGCFVTSILKNHIEVFDPEN